MFLQYFKPGIGVLCSILNLPFFSIRLPSEPDNYVNSGNGGLKTLNLRLDEVAHIRAALTKAELEAIDTKLREEIERGKVLL